MKKLVLCLTCIALCVCLLSCTFCSYSALGLVRLEKDNYCRSSFEYLKGRIVLTTRYTLASEGTIHYKVTLEEGEINLYYKDLGSEWLICNVKAGQTVDDTGWYIEKGKVSIIIETVSPAKGEVEVYLTNKYPSES